MRRLRAALGLVGAAAWAVAALPALPCAAAEEAGADGSGAAKAAPRPASKAAAPEPTWFALALAHSELGINVAYFWAKGPKLRAETVIAGRKIVSLVNGDTYYAYDATGREGVAIGRAKAAIAKDAPDRRPFGRELEVVLQQGGEKVGEEQVGGRACERFRVTDEAGRREIWVTKDALRLPVRLEIFSRPTGKTVATDFLSWTSALPIEDAFLEPEPGVHLQRLSFDEYAARQFTPVGPVPILYMDLLTGR